MFCFSFCGRELIMRYGLWIKGLQQQKKNEWKKNIKWNASERHERLSYRCRGTKRLREPLIRHIILVEQAMDTVFARTSACTRNQDSVHFNIHILRTTPNCSFSLLIYICSGHLLVAALSFPWSQIFFVLSCDDHSVQRSIFLFFFRGT